MKKLFMVAALWSVACQRETATEELPAHPAIGTRPSSTEPSRDHKADSAEPQAGIGVIRADAPEPYIGEPLARHPTEYIDTMLEKTFGDAARHTQEELRVIEFVEGYLGETENQAFPRPHRHLVRREDSLWVVSVMSLDALRTPGLRAAELLVYVRLGPKGLVVEKTGIKT